MEVFPDIHLLKIPIPGSSLGFLNAYLLKTNKGALLIDTGWNTDVAINELNRQLDEVGVKLNDIKFIAITHTHPDHYGLVGRLEKFTNAKLVIHELERALLDSRYIDYDELMKKMDGWLKSNGVPEGVRQSLKLASLEILGLVVVAMPDISVRGGEHLEIGDWNLEVIWTPGHSPGHLCFYDRKNRILFSGDHILPTITPNISMHVQSLGNPLVDYLNALRQVSELEVDIVMPAHGPVFNNLPQRVDEILNHHEKRMLDMKTTIGDRTLTAYQIAAESRWSGSGANQWESLAPLHRRMAVTETLAHLELMVARGDLSKTIKEDLVCYQSV